MKDQWQTKRICEVSDVFDGPHATPKTVDSGPIFLGIGALQDGVINLEETRHVTELDFKQWTRRVRPQADDVVFSYETRLGQAAIIPEGLECCLGRRMGLVRFKGGSVNPQFFLYQYLSPPFREFLESKTIRGATVDRISIKDFPSFPIAVPPLSEQQRIVGILDEAFEGIGTVKASAEKNLRNASALFKRHLQSVFAQRDDGWEKKTLGDIAQVKGGKRVPKGYKLLVDPTEFPYLRVTDFNESGSIDLSDLRYVSAKVHQEIKNYVIYSTDLYISIAGTIGKTGIIPEELNGANLTENACRLVFQPDISNRFVYYFTVTADFVEQAGLNTRTAAQPKLALSRLSTIKLGIPSLPVQKRLVSKFDALREETKHLESIYQQKLLALEKLKKSLLHQAFTGNL
jgi:restriction endonuclease S subunit